MRFVRIYLVGYFVLVLGALLALWQSGILAQISFVWIAIGLLLAIGLGVILAVTSTRPPISTTHIE
jgi:hypothetical protein